MDKEKEGNWTKKERNGNGIFGEITFFFFNFYNFFFYNERLKSHLNWDATCHNLIGLFVNLSPFLSFSFNNLPRVIFWLVHPCHFPATPSTILDFTSNLLLLTCLSFELRFEWFKMRWNRLFQLYNIIDFETLKILGATHWVCYHQNI